MPDRRGFNYSITEEENLLDIIDELLPIGQMRWETVEQRHSLLYPEQQRTVDSLKKKLGSYTTPNLLPEILTSHGDGDVVMCVLYGLFGVSLCVIVWKNGSIAK